LLVHRRPMLTQATLNRPVAHALVSMHGQCFRYDRSK
jgi:hypothetical protein